MVQPNTPSESLSASRDLLALLGEIDAARPSLAIATPERQRLTFTAWIAQARAAEAILGGNWARQKVAQAADILHRLSRLWWPGCIGALDPRSTPATAWPGAAQERWQDVAAWCHARLERAENWADDAARITAVYRRLFGRAPSTTELKAGQDFLAGEALKQYDERRANTTKDGKDAKDDAAPAAATSDTAKSDGPGDSGMMAGVAPGKAAPADEQKKMRPVTAFGRYVKVLLSSNEFVFVS